MQCVVCGADGWQRAFNRLASDFVKCTVCGLIRMESIPTWEEISAHYAKKRVSGNYELARRYKSEYETVYAQFLKFVLSYSGDPRGQKLLDIGCLTGDFLDLAQQAGFITYGVEYQAEAAQIANGNHGGRVYCGPIEGYSPPPSTYFDVVTASGVIEHVVAPDKMVGTAANLLKQAGLFIIQTPNTISVPARLLGKWWPAFAPVEHIYYFSARNIKILLERYGLRVLKLASHWKKLPLGYAYNQFQNFGPEYYRVLSKIMTLLPRAVLGWRLPVYVGEMIVIAKKA